MSEQAPNVPPSEEPGQAPLPGSAVHIEPVVASIPESPNLLRNRGFLRLWLAQLVSSLGDWIGIIAIIALANRVSSSTGVGLVMTARLLPGFLLAPLGGALLDRWDRRRVMVVCDIGRACLLGLLPIFDTLTGLIVISFMLEVLSLLWGPAKDASVPNVVPTEQLSAANSLGLAAAWGTMPLGAVIFAALAGIAKWLGGFSALHRFSVDQESLAIWVDGLTYVVSALFIMRITLPRQSRRDSENVPWTQTYKDMIEGLTFIRSQPMVRGVMIGIAGGLLGGGLMVPLGPAFAKEVLGGGSGAFGLLMTALGIGVGIGVPLLLWLQRRLRLPTQRVFVLAVIATGAGIIAVACVSTLTPAVLIVVFVGGAAGSGYVTGFTVLQENVADELRGRIFGALYTVVRLCLLLSLTLGPFAASLLDTISKHTVNRRAHIGSVGINLPGVRLALIAGGAFTVFSGMAAQRRMRRALAMTGSGESSA